MECITLWSSNGSAQQREMERNLRREPLGGIQSIVDARIAQRDATQKL